MSTDKYMHLQFDPDYFDCLHLTRMVWKDATGEDLGERLDGLMGARGKRRLRAAHPRAFRRLEAPVSPCLVLMQRPRSLPHVGVYLRGKVLHIQETGVEFVPVDIASRGFKTVKFYQ